MSLGTIDELKFYLFKDTSDNIEVVADKWIETYVEIWYINIWRLYG